MGRPSWFRRRLDRLGERDLLAVPGNPLMRDLEAPPPAYSGRGRRPKRPWPGLDRWQTSLPEEAWTTIDVRDGAKGPLVGDIVTRRVVARTPQRQAGHEETMVVMCARARDSTHVVHVAFYRSHGAAETALAAFARVAKAAHRLEECRQGSTREAGLADDEVRHGTGGHPHQTLSFLATWLLVTETRWGKKWTPAMTFPQICDGIALILHHARQCGTMSRWRHERARRLQRHERARLYHWKQRNHLAPLHRNKRQCEDRRTH